MTQENQYQSSVPPNNTLAIVSLISGILGLSLLPGIASVIAIITGNMAVKEIRASGGTQGGEGMARIGIILGWIAVALTVVAVCCVLVVVAFPFLLAMLGIATEGTGYLPGLVVLAG